MEPSVSRLLAWRPADLDDAGQALLTRSSSLQRVAGQLDGVGADLAAAWSGAAADAAGGHVSRRTREVDALASYVHAAGQTLVRCAEQLAPARILLQGALDAAHAAGCTVDDDGAVHPPAPTPAPTGLSGPAREAWRHEQSGLVAGLATTAARLAAQIRQALGTAGVADDAGSAALAGLLVPQVSPPPQPFAPEPGGGAAGAVQGGAAAVIGAPGGSRQHSWWDGPRHQLDEFSAGLADAVVGPVRSVAGLVGLSGDVSDNWGELAHGLGYGVTHPRDLAAGLIDWQDLADGRYARWLGELVPTAAATVASGGAAVAVRSGRAARDLAAAGQVVRDEQEAARLAEAGRAAEAPEEAPAVRKGRIPDAVPTDLPEQLALAAARQGQGDVIMQNLADAPRLDALYGPGTWVKVSYLLRGTRRKVEVHYFRNESNQAKVEFKFTHR